MINIYYEQISKFFPDIKKEYIFFDYTGIRPKLQGENENFRDFYIKDESEKGHSDFINLIGIESPGLTSCLSIARYVDNLIKS